MRPETPKIVWTLHRNVASPHRAVIAVRRRIIADEGVLCFEIAHTAKAFVSARELALFGTAKTCRGPGERAFHHLLQVYDHSPTHDERRAWRAQREREQQALSQDPKPVWLILPGEPGACDRALRCETRKAPVARCGEGTRRIDIELRLPFRGYHDAPVVSAFALAVHGMARLWVGRSVFVLLTAEPDALLLAQSAQERRGQASDAWAREDAALLVGPPRTGAIRTGAEAVLELGLTLPCTAAEVRRAFRQRVIADRAHPDQGGSDEEFRELSRLRALALDHLDQKALPARTAA